MGYTGNKPNQKARRVTRKVGPEMFHEKYFYPTDANGRAEETPIHRLHVRGKIGPWSSIGSTAKVRVDGAVYVRVFGRRRTEDPTHGAFTNYRKVYKVTEVIYKPGLVVNI
jgi:hypothetical protein